jgi:hypothetical protein
MANAPAKLCISRGTELAPIWSGALSTNSTPCASSHSKQGVGKGADDLAVVIAVIGKAVGTDDRPVCQVAEQQVGRIFNAVFLLDAGGTAERDIAAADYCSLPTDDCADRPVAADREVVAQNRATDAAATRGAASSPFAVTALSVRCEK